MSAPIPLLAVARHLLQARLEVDEARLPVVTLAHAVGEDRRDLLDALAEVRECPVPSELPNAGEDHDRDQESVRDLDVSDAVRDPSVIDSRPE
jgi:hypothetical protein